jgi:hypothetical protein
LVKDVDEQIDRFIEFFHLAKIVLMRFPSVDSALVVGLAA